jgi:hypothetical protein
LPTACEIRIAELCHSGFVVGICDSLNVPRGQTRFNQPMSDKSMTQRVKTIRICGDEFATAALATQSAQNRSGTVVIRVAGKYVVCDRLETVRLQIEGISFVEIVTQETGAAVGVRTARH